MQTGKARCPTEGSVEESRSFRDEIKTTASGIILGMDLRRLFVFLLALEVLFCGFASGQQATASVSFKLDFPGSNPSHYEIVISSDGQGFYLSNGKVDDNSDAADSAPIKFVVSENVRKQVFELAKKAHYFTGKVDSGRKNLANTGTKSLAYKDAEHNSEATYNYSMLQPVAELTAIFQNLSITMEFGGRLVYFHKYEKLALDDQLKQMEELQRENSLGDVESIAPILKDIANDPSVMNVSRARALRLLATAGK